jgi:hypothetical protein
MWRRSSRSLPRRKPSTPGCTPITISARTRPWIWRFPRACFGPTGRPASTPPTGRARSSPRRRRHWSSTSSSHPVNHRQPLRPSSSRCASHPAATSRSAPGASRCQNKSLAGRTVTVWADLRSIHLSLDGEVVRTVQSRLVPEDLTHLAMRGARPAGPQPDRPALRRANGMAVVRPGDVVEIDRTVTKDGVVSIAGSSHLVGFAWARRRVTLRLDGHLMHAVIDNALVGTWPCPIDTDQLGRLSGARTPSTPLPPPPLPPGSLRAQRKVHASGRIMVAGQNIKLGPRHRGKIVTVVIEDTHLRVMYGEEEIAVRPRRNLKPITRFHVTGAGVNNPNRQASPDDNPSKMS